MKNRFWKTLLIFIVLTSLLSACEKSASINQISTPTANGSLSFPTPLPTNALSSILAGTQTSEALTNPTEVNVVTATSTSKVIAATSTVVVNIATAIPTVEIISTSTPSNPTATMTKVTVIHTSTSTSYSGTPAFNIVSVVANSTVTISTVNFPPNRTFNVLMGTFNSQALNGTLVKSFNSGAGGSFTATYNIPASLQGLSQIAIRIQDTVGYYYAYNWFWNTTA